MAIATYIECLMLLGFSTSNTYVFHLFSSSLQLHMCILSPTHEYQNLHKKHVDTNITNISTDTDIILEKYIGTALLSKVWIEVL